MTQRLIALSLFLFSINLQAEERLIQPTYAGKQDKITSFTIKAELKQFRKIGKVIELRDRIAVQKLAIADYEHLYKTAKKLQQKEAMAPIDVLKAKSDIDVARAELAYLKAEREKSIAEALIQKYTIIERGNDNIDMRLEIAKETDKSYDANIAMAEAEIAKIKAREPYYKKRKEAAEKLMSSGNHAITTNEMALRKYLHSKVSEKMAAKKYFVKALKLAKKSLAKSIQKLEEERD